MRVVKHFVDLNKIILGYSCAKVIKYFVKNEIYLISERENEAEDNGYHLYKYIRENYPKEKAYYLVNKNSKGYKRVKELGNIIDYDSLKHYIYYFLSKKHISAFQFFGVPNSALIWFLESKGFFKKQRIFLQHGITKENISALKYENKKYDLFICGGKPEHNYIKEYFGYPEQSVIYTGFSRYDELHNRKKNKKQILLMPTWRQWLGMTNMGNDKNQDYKNLIKSDYYKSYMSFINSNELN
ncbi:CDP-glycerol glycerophosphotransferase family protein [Cetobacterium somerae]|nr:CDP-glycerol glycerophosphotransferase family protein [Cetobacterium somerae]